MVSHTTSVGGHMLKCLGRCAVQVVSFDHVFKQLKRIVFLVIQYKLHRSCHHILATVAMPPS